MAILGRQHTAFPGDFPVVFILSRVFNGSHASQQLSFTVPLCDTCSFAFFGMEFGFFSDRWFCSCLKFCLLLRSVVAVFVLLWRVVSICACVPSFNILVCISMEVGESSKINRSKRRNLVNKYLAKRRKISTLSSVPGVHNNSDLVSDIATNDQKLDYVADNDSVVHSGSEVSRILNLGLPDLTCQFCGAIFWYAERVKSNSMRRPVYNTCCRGGKINLPLLRSTPLLLDELLDCEGPPRSKKFQKYIRIYNSMFAFTSLGGKIDRTTNDSQGPFVFKLGGQSYHRIGSLLPIDGEAPKFAQLYIHDTDHEVFNRMMSVSSNDNNSIDGEIVGELICMLDEINEIAKAFRMARDRFLETNIRPIKLRLCAKRSGDGPEYNAPVSSEIVGLIVGDFGDGSEHRDIIIEDKIEGLKRISESHPSFMSMQYPLLFPYGEDGYLRGFRYEGVLSGRTTERTCMTMREYYAFRLQQRHHEGKTLIRGGKLFQQYIVDAFSCVEEERLHFIRYNQKKLRTEKYQGVCDAYASGNADGGDIGKQILLPSTFTGGPRYMMQNYHDAMAICKFYGYPDFFITFTCNSKWPEITNALRLIPGQKIEDRPDIITRVFKMKLDCFLSDIRSGKYVGEVIAVVYTIEFQKRGLPHVHMVVWCHSSNKCQFPTDIDRFISAEIPDESTEPLLFDTVKRFMVHGPCGVARPSSSCMSDGRCTKHYPKFFHQETTIDENGFALYRRRDDGKTIFKNGHALDNRFIVPYNKDLLLRYQAHVNIEWCNKSTAIKYLFKYINKGPDRSRAVLEEDVLQNAPAGERGTCMVIDEIKQYVDCRYLAAYESVWRLFEYHIHFRHPSVERLPIHLPFQQNIYYDDHRSLSSIIQQPDVEKTMFTEWMRTNSWSESAKNLTYSSFPSEWVWNAKYKEWTPRQRGQSIGRMFYVHPNSGELYYLRLLLNVQKGPTSYVDIRTVAGFVHSTFQSACMALVLLGNDKEWHDALDEAYVFATGSQLRQLFVTLILFCHVSDPLNLWDKHWMNFQDDILYKLRHQLNLPYLNVSDIQLKNHILFELEMLFNKSGSSLAEHELPMPNGQLLDELNNRLLREEMNYDINQLRHECRNMGRQLNEEQRVIYDVIIDKVNKQESGLYFVYGHGGTGKTFLYQTIIATVRSTGRIVLAVASSGIASLLLPGGRTAHSRFKIPLQIDDQSTCHIKKGTQLAKLIAKASLIVWDEAPMMHRHCFEVVDRTLQDILNINDNEENCEPFGGKTVLLGGDFRQILPVVVNGTRYDTVNASITKSRLWKHCKVFSLKQNMRLQATGLTVDERTSMAVFAQWILDVGDGQVPYVSIEDGEEEPSWIRIPDELLLKSNGDLLDSIIAEIYDNLENSYNNTEYLNERAIITGTNDIVAMINTRVLALLRTDERTYYSFDSVCKTSENSVISDMLYTTEILNSMTFNGIPNHELTLKKYAPIMLLRNLNQVDGLCNGTRLLITHLGDKVIEAKVLSGSNVGDNVCIPRIIMDGKDHKYPFILKRRQFPVRLCYAMTINKSQGQTLKKVGLYLPKPIFTHGQFYVAISRVTSKKGLKIVLDDHSEKTKQYTRNIVYHEIFDELAAG
ncbi:uncharacterized protein LOC120012542 [Tripterygium wilfordii]|uniref:uncharacterized protein LOC120012542 n=1 Tax=Tripterygium wilfordii TaxID=458696 RepID=UPI0018F81E80|nr:uncharacterized protein LOC120012542 [Tripterygium wilfordii]